MKEMDLVSKRKDMIIGNTLRTVITIDSKDKKKTQKNSNNKQHLLTRKSRINKNCSGCSRKRTGSNRRG